MGARGPKSKFTDIACPNVLCPDYGITEIENMAVNGTYETQHEKVQKFLCRTRRKSFNSRSVTVFYDLRTKKETLILGNCPAILKTRCRCQKSAYCIRSKYHAF